MIQETSEAMMASPLLVEETSARAPPYFRFLLSSKSLPPYLPAAMETHVPIETWAAFWSRMAPYVRRVELFETIYQTVLLVLAAVWCGFVFYLPTIVDSLFVVYLSAILIVVPMGAVITVSGRVRQSQLESVRTFCREEEERAFRRHGFVLECDYEFFNNGTCGLYVYFLPGAAVDDEQSANSRHVYLRIEVWSALLAGSGWNSISLPALSSYEYLPSGFEALSHDEWAEFWSKFIEVSRECQSAIRLRVVIQGTLLVYIVSLQLVSEYDAAFYVVFVLIIPYLCAVFYALRRFRNVIKKPPLVVAEYADKFAQHGVYMEYRKLLKFHRSSGPRCCHYVYLFPRTISNLVLTEDVGSIQHESSTRRRMSGNTMV
jgi:hypothetical protein